MTGWQSPRSKPTKPRPGPPTAPSSSTSGSRSGTVTEALSSRGYDVVNLVGGLQAWIAEGLPLVADDGHTGSVL